MCYDVPLKPLPSAFQKLYARTRENRQRTRVLAKVSQAQNQAAPHKNSPVLDTNAKASKQSAVCVFVLRALPV